MGVSPTIHAYSTALFSTWYFFEEWGIAFDAGDGLISALLQKSRKIDHVFISHADRDHLTGLLQLNQLNARPGFPVVYYPKDAQSFPTLEAFSKQFDAQVTQTIWRPVTEGDEVPIAKDLLVLPIRNGHVPVAQHIIKSLGYLVVQTRKKLKPEYAHLSGEALRQLGEQIGRDNLSIEIRDKVLAYSGDTPVEVLGHFSSRYSAEEIDRGIKDLCGKYAIDIPVRRILPGETVSDLLNTPPLNL